MTPIERKALEFLSLGPDAPGVVDSEEVMAAHIVFLDLVKRGLVAKDMGDEGPIYSLTPAGLAVLAAPTQH